MAEILTTIVGLLDPAEIKQFLKVQFSYLCCSNSILKNLEAEIQKLDRTRDNLQQRVATAVENLEIIRPLVEEWLTEVDEIEKKKNGILGAIPEVQQGCVNRSCPNLKSRYSVTRKAKKMTDVVALVERTHKFDTVADERGRPARITFASGTTFDSRKNIQEEIMAALRNDKVYLIGICGMGGVGKTTMANKIKEWAEEKNLFRVAMAAVSQQLDPKRIQQEVAEALGLTLKEETVSKRAEVLHERLMQEKSILIIIDDIWEKIKLKEIGIPSQRDKKECKIILTSRNRDVRTQTEAWLRHGCTEIEATETGPIKIFPLEYLREEEAWALFRATAGTCVDDRDLHKIAEEVAKECKGLPLALVTVACALADQHDKHVWDDALTKLRRSAASNISGAEDMYRIIQWSYNHLKDNEAKYLFLLCSLFPEDSPISLKDLLYYGIGLRIFSQVETLREARDRVYSLVELLKSRNMLMDGGEWFGIKYVKMHDVIRDMAISVASKYEHVFMISHDIGLKDWPRKD